MSRILDALHRQAQQSPHRIALQGDAAVLTWSELHTEVSRLAAELEGNLTCGILMANSPAWVIADLAALRAGITCVPMPPFFSAEQLRHAVTDAGISLLLTDQPEGLAELFTIRGQQSITLARQSLSLLQLEGPASSHGGIAKITYTSGTTGQPKGVPLTLDTIETVTASLCEAAGVTDRDRALALLPLSTLLENIASLYVPILAGAQMLVPFPDSLGIQGSSKLDAVRLAAKLRELLPSGVILPPQLLKVFIGLAAAHALPDSFRFIAVGGAPVARQQLVQAQVLGLPAYQGYGFSEAASVVAVNRPDANRPGSVGKPLAHCKVKIAPDGEVLVKGARFQGYLNRPPHEADEWLPSGDLGYLEAGYLYITGRKREIIISSYGRNISPEWVEAELLSETDIAQAAVFGNNRPFLSAVVVPAASASDQAVQAAISRSNARLPDYARVLSTVIAQQPFSQAHGELTANGRPRRDVIERNYRASLDQCYEDAS